jgi:4-amino-4-deoxy-L-arabinose transferase-like glycosyltransferase
VDKIARSPLVSVLFLSAVAAATLLFRLGALPFIGADEPRYARIAEEMSRGGRWVTPVLEGRPWLEKPPLYYWTTIPIIRLFGTGEAPARLGSALWAVAAAASIFWLGLSLRDRLAGLLGAGILLTTLGYCGLGRSASTDMPLTASLTITLSILARAGVSGVPAGLLGLAYVFLGLSVLAKGPVALVLAGAVAAVFWCFRPGWHLRSWRPVSGLAIVAAVSLPWFWLVFRENGFNFISVFFINHNLARYVVDLHHHKEPFWYYGPVLLGLFVPWSGWLILLVPRWDSIRDIGSWPKRDPGSFFLVVWAVVPVLFFSLSTAKLAGYILPVLPPLALLLGMRFSELMKSKQVRNAVMQAAAWATFGMAAALAVALPIVFSRKYASLAEGALLGVVALVPALFGLAGGLRGRWGAAWMATLLQGAALILAVTLAGFPVLARYHSTREIASEALEHRQAGEPLVTFRFFHHSLHYYAGYTVAAHLPDRASLEEFAATCPALLVVTETIRVPELESMTSFSTSVLAEQGKLRLVRLQRRP